MFLVFKRFRCTLYHHKSFFGTFSFLSLSWCSSPFGHSLYCCLSSILPLFIDIVENIPEDLGGLHLLWLGLSIDPP